MNDVKGRNATELSRLASQDTARVYVFNRYLRRQHEGLKIQKISEHGDGEVVTVELHHPKSAKRVCRWDGSRWTFSETLG